MLPVPVLKKIQRFIILPVPGAFMTIVVASLLLPTFVISSPILITLSVVAAICLIFNSIIEHALLNHVAKQNKTMGVNYRFNNSRETNKPVSLKDDISLKKQSSMLRATLLLITLGFFIGGLFSSLPALVGVAFSLLAIGVFIQISVYKKEEAEASNFSKGGAFISGLILMVLSLPFFYGFSLPLWGIYLFISATGLIALKCSFLIQLPNYLKGECKLDDLEEFAFNHQLTMSQLAISPFDCRKNSRRTTYCDTDYSSDDESDYDSTDDESDHNPTKIKALCRIEWVC